MDVEFLTFHSELRVNFETLRSDNLAAFNFVTEVLWRALRFRACSYLFDLVLFLDITRQRS